MAGRAIIEQMKSLGFTDYEAKCYLALLERESLSVSEISKLALIPRPNTYESLEKLMAKGLSVSLPGKVKRYSAIDPYNFKDGLISSTNENFDKEIKDWETRGVEIQQRKSDARENINDVISKLSDLFKASRGEANPLEYIEVLENNEQIHRKHVELANMAKKEIVTISRPPFPYTSVSNKARDQQSKAIDEAVSRGVKLRTIHMIPSDEAEKDEFLRDVNKYFNPDLEQMRMIDELPMKMSIYDEKIAFYILEFPLVGSNALTAMVVNHPAMAKMQMKTFEAYWNEASASYILDGVEYFLDKRSAVKKRKKS